MTASLSPISNPRSTASRLASQPPTEKTNAMRPVPQLALAAVILLEIILPAGVHAGPQSARPNIVFLLADDMGFADITAFGGRFGYTPHLDRLAASGIRMTNFHTPCAVCSPTRAAILTGRYPLANGIDSHFNDSPRMVLRDQTRPDGGPGTLPGILREHGYATLHIGKWHLGGVTLQELEHRRTGQGKYRNHGGPHQHGFDDYYISQEDTTTGIRAGMLSSRTTYRDATKHLVHNGVYRFNPNESRDWTAFKVDVASRFIQDRVASGQPFFLNVWFDEPHAPYEDDHVPPPYHFDALSRQVDAELGRLRHVLNTALPATGNGGQDDHKKFLSMVTYMDHQVGRILEQLEDPNSDGNSADSILSNTLIVFTSDNGGAWPADNGPFSSGKASMREGGIRVPLVAVWQGRFAAEGTSEALGNSVDMLPTLLAAAGIDVPQGKTTDGINLLPHWTEGRPVQRPTMFFDILASYRHQRHGPMPEPLGYTAAIKDGMKLIINNKVDRAAAALYDLHRDPQELHNLLENANCARVVQELRQDLNQWLDQQPPPIPRSR